MLLSGFVVAVVVVFVVVVVKFLVPLVVILPQHSAKKAVLLCRWCWMFSSLCLVCRRNNNDGRRTRIFLINRRFRVVSRNEFQL